jgi:hypothetical protein
MSDTETYSLAIGSIRGFIRWQVQTVDVTGLGAYRFVQADLSADGRFMGVLNMHGELSCLSIEDGRVSAVLAGSAPFTAIAPGAEGPEFWLVEARARIFGCSLIEGEA